MAAHKLVVIGACIAILLACVASQPALQRALGAPGYAVTGSDSARVEQLTEKLFSRQGSEIDLVLFHSSRFKASEKTYRATIAAVDQVVRAQRNVRSVVGPYDPNAVGQILEGEHTAITLASLGGSPAQRFNQVRALQAAVARAAPADSGVQALWSGPSPVIKDLSDAQQADTQRAAGIGLPVAFVILLLALGALVAAILPLLFAISGLLLADGVLGILALIFHFDSLLLAIVTMIGLGIGIDYSLFIVSRFREEYARSASSEQSESERVADAVGVALATSGRTIMFSGVIVGLSMASVLVVNSNLFREIAVGSVVVVVCMLATAMTLLPAVLALLGGRVNKGALPRRLQPADARPRASGERREGWARWALLVMRKPLFAAITTVLVLLVAAIPVLHLHYGFDVGVLREPKTVTGKAQKILARAVSQGVAAPIQIIVTDNGGQHNGAYLTAARSLSEKLETDTQITGVAERKGKGGVLLTAIPAVPLGSPAVLALVRHIRNDLAPPLEDHGHLSVFVGGSVAQVIDVTHEVDSKILLVMALILGSSLVFLLMALRSVVLPIKAVIMNLLATGATIGLTVWIFQDGHVSHLLGFASVGFIQFTVPMIMFALLFGLSMDYEIFLMRRIQEERHKSGDDELAIAAGIEHTARPIMAAAAIMVAVFGSFVTAGLLELKQLGFALAVAIALDATLIRLVLVPATMKLLGRRNWWLPAWLARALPNLGID
jgi:RND superfamily putative drug exporter